MNIRAREEIHETARQALNRAPHARQILMTYIGINLGLSLLLVGLSFYFSNQISGTGGLGNIGLRSVLSTGQSVLPLVQLLINACLNLGYHIAILCIIRNFEASTQTLFTGFRFFFPMLRLLLLQVFLYAGLMFLSVYISSFIFMATPFSREFMAVITPVLESVTVMDTTLVLDDATFLAASQAVIPMFWIMIPVCALLALPLFYRLRMATFALADEPRRGALAAFVKSRRLMRGNCTALFRLDLSMWWFYLGQIIISLVCYGDVLLPMLGITLPFSETTGYFLFYGVYLVLQFAICWLFLNRVSVTYALAYQSILPEKPKDNGVVLGNIFQM